VKYQIPLFEGEPLEVIKMFESLDDQMKHDAMAEATTRQRWLKYILIGAASVVVVGGIFAVQFIK
jgi:hypothetical protein